MVFESFTQAQSLFLWSAFGLALIMGAVANKTNFCTMGAVSDWVNMGDTGRMRAWLLAIAVAILGLAVLEAYGLARPGESFPPYRTGQLTWVRNILGGILFGIGMTLGSGCGNKTLVRIGGGNIKSIMVLLVIGIVSYFMGNPFPGTDQTLDSLLFFPWTSPLTVDVGAAQDVGTLILGAETAASTRLIVGLLVAAVLLAVIFKSREFRGSADNIIGGVVIGLVIVGAWYMTSNIAVSAEGQTFSLRNFITEQWDFYAQPQDVRPHRGHEAMAPQSFTFINPMGQFIGYTSSGFSKTLLTFGVMSVFGVILGSFLWSLVSRSFRVEWFASGKDFVNHIIGAVLMGFGGTLAMGCTIGQAVTGISTLALGSVLSFASIVLGSALTMKIQYYKMVYEDEATFGKAFITALVDMKLLPAAMRKLEAV